jgi:hypothetical protein
MHIQINTNHNIAGREALADHVRSVVADALSRFSGHITRGHDDKRCMLEARIEGRQPLAVTHEAATLHQAVEAAAGKLSRMIEHTLGRAARSEGSQA